MVSKLVYQFPQDSEATLAEVGGKGLSLMEGSKAGLPIPPGFILSADFFSPWMQKLKTTNTWSTFLKAKDKELQHACDNLKKEALTCTFTSIQKESLEESLQSYTEHIFFAVRSSSPEEDLEGASFAGGYETVLGVSPNHLEAAIKKAFVSCLDYRVVMYKKENSFDATNPKIAVIIQQQVASEISGVGFSLNPVTNNYDEAVFNANWGLGETVVAGLATPDTYTVDKVFEKIKQKTIGAKELSLWLSSKGGTEKKLHYKSNERTLSDKQVIQLTELIKNVEQYYEKPMDIEWAYVNDQLFLLQARPITSYVPLGTDMLTQPGKRKRLYLDVTVTAQGMNQPVSQMGTSMFRQLLKIIGRIVAARDITRDIDKTVGWISEGKIFINLSNAFALVGRKKALEILSIMDSLGAKAVEQLDEKTYASSTPRLLLLPYGLLWRLPGIALFLHRATNDPDAVHQQVQKNLDLFEQEARTIAQKDMPLQELVDTLIHKMFFQVFRRTVPLTLLSRIMLNKLKQTAGDEPEIQKLELALPHNVTTEMGLALSRVAELLPNDFDAKHGEEQLARIPQWQEFLDKYGHRGASEIDLAAPRYSDNPKILLDLLSTMKKMPGENPRTKFDRGQSERKEAYQALYEKILVKKPNQAKAFTEQFRVFETFGGYRETHKYYLVLIVALIREKIVKQAESLVAQNRLDTVEQVFDLTLGQLDQAKNDTSMDLRKLAKTNTLFLKKLARISQPPAIIDSRGFIPRPPIPPAGKGEHVGMPISAGIIRGRTKTLHTPDEKPLKKGEILIARATDPGWTPLFVNAAGLILEIGGLLQHGALVAREYGLPCVAGIENATNIWKDGTLIEIDGASGIIRTIEE